MYTFHYVEIILQLPASSQSTKPAVRRAGFSSCMMLSTACSHGRLISTSFRSFSSWLGLLRLVAIVNRTIIYVLFAVKLLFTNISVTDTGVGVLFF